ncbi:hypothetical protein [Dendronalium sp. ChiSLP03b]|uniref:hypothetical protein n=1 Tax=Dendronalium sp. ChiSLP03b TaxID=3075381 RepID=UPI003919B5B5
MHTVIFNSMFIEANNKEGRRILINVNAIAYVEMEADVWIEDQPTPAQVSGVRVYFQVSRGDVEKVCPVFQEFIDKEAENLRLGLSKLLDARRFS